MSKTEQDQTPISEAITYLGHALTLYALYQISLQAIRWLKDPLNPANHYGPEDTITHPRSERVTAKILTEIMAKLPNLIVLHEPVKIIDDDPESVKATIPDWILLDSRLGPYGPVTAVESKIHGDNAVSQRKKFESGAPPNWTYVVSNDKTRKRAETAEEHIKEIVGPDLLATLTKD